MRKLIKDPYTLHVLRNSKCEKFKKAIIQHCPDDTIKCLSEIIHNLLIGNINIKPSELAKLRKSKSKLKSLHSELLKRRSIKERRKILIKNQSGGILGSLLTAALGALIDYGVNKISDQFKNK